MFRDTSKTKSPDYLFRNPHSYCFRLGVPESLRPIVGRWELRYSLKTGRLSEARFKARLMAGLCQQFFAQIRANPAAYSRSGVESRIQEFLGFVRKGSESLLGSNLGSEVFTAGAGIKIRKLIDEFVGENLRSNRWTERTRKDYLSCLNIFIRFFGDVGIGAISYSEMREYKKMLMKLPPNLSKKHEYQDLSLNQICDANDGKNLSVAAVNKNLGVVGSLFRFGIRHGYVESDYTSGLRLPKKRRPDEERSRFTQGDLKRLFHSTEYRYGTHRHAWCYWIPILGLLTGARLEEICQLYVEDVRMIDDIGAGPFIGSGA